MLITLFTLAVMVLVFASLYGIVKTVIMPKKRLNERLRSIDTRDPNAKENTENRTKKKGMPTFKERVILPFERKAGSFFLNLAPNIFKADVEKLLLVAGKRKVWTVRGFTIFRGIVLLLSVLLALYYVWNHRSLIFIQRVVLFGVCTAFGALLPILVLRTMAQNRQKQILKQLPEVFDLLCVSVQAGLSFDAAIKRIVDHMTGPFIEEFKNYLDDMRMGIPRRQALKQMAERCDIPEVSLFATSLIQAERLGTGIGRTLSNQSANMRDRRRQQVKAEAMKAPVKMLFPLVIFIFPAIFVVVLLPSVLNLIKSFLR